MGNALAAVGAGIRGVREGNANHRMASMAVEQFQNMNDPEAQGLAQLLAENPTVAMGYIREMGGLGKVYASMQQRQAANQYAEAITKALGTGGPTTAEDFIRQVGPAAAAAGEPVSGVTSLWTGLRGPMRAPQTTDDIAEKLMIRFPPGEWTGHEEAIRFLANGGSIADVFDFMEMTPEGHAKLKKQGEFAPHISVNVPMPGSDAFRAKLALQGREPIYDDQGNFVGVKQIPGWGRPPGEVAALKAAAAQAIQKRASGIPLTPQDQSAIQAYEDYQLSSSTDPTAPLMRGIMAPDAPAAQPPMGQPQMAPQPVAPAPVMPQGPPPGGPTPDMSYGQPVPQGMPSPVHGGMAPPMAGGFNPIGAPPPPENPLRQTERDLGLPPGFLDQ